MKRDRDSGPPSGCNMMNFVGLLVVGKSSDRVAETLLDPATLAAILPACKSIRTISDGHHLARIEHHALPIGMDVDLTCLPTEDGVAISVKAGNLIFGKVRSDFNIALTAAPNGCRMRWTGELTATGLAKNILSGRELDVQDHVQALFRRIKARAEAPVKAAPKAGAA